MATLFRFPPANIDRTDATYLTGKSEAFAKLKIESKAGKRTVFGLDFEALLLFLPGKLLRSLAAEQVMPNTADHSHYTVFRNNELTAGLSLVATSSRLNCCSKLGVDGYRSTCYFYRMSTRYAAQYQNRTLLLLRYLNRAAGIAYPDVQYAVHADPEKRPMGEFPGQPDEHDPGPYQCGC
ncbi:MAG: hypothetical protein WC615_01695 [Mucilaginibacter sp.]|jgi:hypothetical protein|uniref:hypothetical protein n=1 Tax=Mucilaginibacter sp. TaxID=1882438 RepID=UPI003565176B